MPRVALAAEDERTAGEVARVASARGFPVERFTLAAAVEAPVGAVAYAPRTPPDIDGAAKLAPLCRRASQANHPIVLLAAFDKARGPKQAAERAAALSYLRAHGAVIAVHPDEWFEAAVLLAAYGPPDGPQVAVVAPEGGWLHLEATALTMEAESRGGPRLPISVTTEAAPLADMVLVDAGEVNDETPERVGKARVVPVCARAEALPPDRPALVGLRSSLAAAMLCGRYAQRLAEGLGPVTEEEQKRLKVDTARTQKAFAHAGDRLGDHETKLLLSAYGVSVTRQGVATTPSAAVRIAKTCDFPVEIKPWEPSAPTEAEGGPLVVDIQNPPEVRRAFASVATDAGLEVGAPVIVRTQPPEGREIRARIEAVGALGWTLLLEVPTAQGPLAAPAPLRKIDAEELASALEASRAGDEPPDRGALADLLLRASLCAVRHEDQIASLDLARIVVAPRGQGAMLVDARAPLKRKRQRP